MQLRIPDFALVVLVGASGSGKSTFAARHFAPTEILSSDRLRGWVADDEADQAATTDAFDVLHYIAGKRLAARRLTVVDATSVRPEDRRLLIDLARRYHALPVAIVLDMPDALCIERNKARPDRDFGAHVVRNQIRLLRRSIRGLQRGYLRLHRASQQRAAVPAAHHVESMLAEKLVQHMRISREFPTELNAMKADFRGVGQHGFQRRVAAQFRHVIVDPGDRTYTETYGHYSSCFSFVILSS